MNIDKSYFDYEVDRIGSHSYKWDAAEDPEMLPMWVADMDFRTAPSIIRALEHRASHGIFGYTQVPHEYFQATVDWFESRHAFTVSPETLLYTTGVVSAVSATLQALCKPGDGVIVQTPAYNCFFTSIQNSQCILRPNPLLYQNGTYSIDFEDLKSIAAEPNTKIMLLCNPHNPVGRVWSRHELQLIGDICLENNVVVLSDEIHCDLTQSDSKHIPFGSMSNSFLMSSVTYWSPSKTFNLAGLKAANILVSDSHIKQLISKQLKINEVSEINPFAVDGLIAAYRDGASWLDTLNDYLADNYKILVDFFEQHLPQLYVLPLEATYLVWVDCSALSADAETVAKTIYREQKLWITHGTLYGPEGEGFLRINIATTKQRLVEGLNRFKAALSPGSPLL